MRRVLIRLAPLGCLLGVLVLAYAMGWHRNLTLQTLVENNGAIDAFIAAHRIAAILSFVVIYAIGAILAMPAGAVLAVVGGFLFGALIGGAAAMVGSTLGATAVLLIGRSAFRELLLRRLGPRVESFAAGFRADAFCYVMFLRLMPVPSWFTNLTAALFAVRLRTFVGATAIGRIPGSFLLALFGAGLEPSHRDRAGDVVDAGLGRRLMRDRWIQLAHVASHPRLDQPSARAVHRSIEGLSVEPVRVDVMEEVGGRDRCPPAVDAHDDPSESGLDGYRD